ncbi:hypothetical protein [Actinomadura sp. 9N407]|uniref:hypothetical protein n=1 Tax=Actinomadura sp. 9N407 TaxID=3375154 RepID=UPI003788AC25
MTFHSRSLTGAGPWVDLIEDLIDDPGHLAARASWYSLVLIVTTFTGAAVLAGVRSLLWRWRNNRLTEGARLIEIALPPNVEESSAAAWWSHLAGLASPWWKRALYGQPHLAWEFVADVKGLRVQI